MQLRGPRECTEEARRCRWGARAHVRAQHRSRARQDQASKYRAQSVAEAVCREGEVRVRVPVLASAADGGLHACMRAWLDVGALANVQRLLQPSSRLTWEEFK